MSILQWLKCHTDDLVLNIAASEFLHAVQIVTLKIPNIDFRQGFMLGELMTLSQPILGREGQRHPLDVYGVSFSAPSAPRSMGSRAPPPTSKCFPLACTGMKPPICFVRKQASKALQFLRHCMTPSSERSTSIRESMSPEEL